MKSTSCPRCSAEFYSPEEECFSCGLIFKDFVEPTVEETEGAKISVGGKEIQVEPGRLSIGTTILERYTILAKMGEEGRWFSYRIIDMISGEEAWMKIAKKNHPLALLITQAAVKLGKSPYFRRVLDSAVHPFPFVILQHSETTSLLSHMRGMSSLNDRFELIEQFLLAMLAAHRNGLTLMRYVPTQIQMLEGCLQFSPTMATTALNPNTAQADMRNILNLLYWILSGEALPANIDVLPQLKGVSPRFAQWLRRSFGSRYRSAPSFLASWRSFQKDQKGVNRTVNGRELYPNIFKEHLVYGDNKYDDIMVSRLVEHHLIYGTTDCVQGAFIGSFEPLIAAYRGIYFSDSDPYCTLLYRIFVEGVVYTPKTIQYALFEEALEAAKFLKLINEDWEFAWEQAVKLATRGSHIIALNRAIVLYELGVERLPFPEELTLSEYLELTAYYFWISGETDAAEDSLEKIYNQIEDVYELLRYCEAKRALSMETDRELLDTLRDWGAQLSLQDELELIENVQNILGEDVDDWIDAIQLHDSMEQLLWCRSPFSSQSDRDHFLDYFDSLL
ncbi:MAG: hypothetical protein VX278_23405, partial [Myxococcota bacterium]|nr:hypothetical protein [Myxococcota bacterium]